MNLEDKIAWAARNIARADALIFTAGAGMGVDSGLPDFRGNQGFWNAYPPYKELGFSFQDLASPIWFEEDPKFAWGFYGHRLGLYRKTVPHVGYEIMLKWGNQKRNGYQVYTSNVDGAFRKAGFDSERIVECHGRIELGQCVADCGIGIFSLDDKHVHVDEKTFRASGDMPTCPNCNSIARPNILMFGDWGWDSSLRNEQRERMSNWVKENRTSNVVVIECGAGLSIPTVRNFGETLSNNLNAKLIRINVSDYQVPDPTKQVGISLGAMKALSLIDDQLKTIVT